tara:strand:+ start:146 stop:535 length:390 start_codon:yes stop_codon:yes gene_type:complete
MASILRVNTLTDASSNNSTPMATVNQGTAKVWINFNGEGTIASRDSFNVSGLTDVATGTYNVGITNNLGNADYVTTGGGGDSNASMVVVQQPHDSLEPTTSLFRVTSVQTHSTILDEPYIGAAIHGDSA